MWDFFSLTLSSQFIRSDSEIIGYALDTLYNIICNDEEEEQGIEFSHNLNNGIVEKGLNPP